MARKKTKPEVMLVCANCGKQPPIDKEKSNENWVVYITSAPCECGGHWRHKLVETQN